MKRTKNTIKIITYIAIFLTVLLTLSFVIMLYRISNSINLEKNFDAEAKNYHIVVTGKNQNEAFLKEVYNGARKYSNSLNAMVELYVPKSQAEDSSIQELFEYASFLNADGIIACIDSPEEVIPVQTRINQSQIPVVTTGQFAPNTNQICYIGINYWQFGKTLADKAAELLGNQGTTYIINNNYNRNINLSNIVNGFQRTLDQYKNISIKTLDSPEDIHTIQELTETEANSQNINKPVIICLTEEDTINAGQIFSEFYSDSKVSIIGYGNNDSCKLFLDKGILSELIYLDPEQIGKTAIKELFEYITTGYANSYISADTMILKADK